MLCDIVNDVVKAKILKSEDQTKAWILDAETRNTTCVFEAKAVI